MSATPLAQLSEAGVSIWLDDLSRGRLTSGGLAKLIAESHVTGVTTNPSIFQAAITAGTDYDDQLADLRAAGRSADEAVLALTTRDVRDACDLFADVAAATDGVDGRVSIEALREAVGQVSLTLLDRLQRDGHLTVAQGLARPAGRPRWPAG